MPHIRQPPPLAVNPPASPSAFDASKCTVCVRCRKRYVEPGRITRGPLKGEPTQKCIVCSGRLKAADCPAHLMIPIDPSNGYVVCSKCEKRYVEPEAVFRQGPNKLEQCDKCDVCRNLMPHKMFPHHLIVPSELRAKGSIRQSERDDDVKQATEEEASIEELWIESLDPESQSLLLHGKAILKGLPSTARLADLPRAVSEIQWDAIEDRLRDVYELDRLFKNFKSLRGHYQTEVNTVAPIGLITVSLNNCAVQKSLPFKLCWLHVPLRTNAHIEQTGASSTLFLALSAWSAVEKEQWRAATPEQRLKMCSAWESTIRPSSKVIIIPYAETQSPRIEKDGQLYFEVVIRRCLVWVRSISKNADKGVRSGSLFFPDGQKQASSLPCPKSADLLDTLCQEYHSQVSKVDWKTLQQSALDELHKVREASKIVRELYHNLLAAHHNPNRDGSNGDRPNEDEDQ